MTHDSAMRELHEEMSDDQLALGRRLETIRGDVGPAFGESLRRGLGERRMLIVAGDASSGDAVETAVRRAGMHVQRITGDEPIETETVDGLSTIPQGSVAVLDAAAFEALHANPAPSLADTAQAITTMVASSRLGSTVDHIVLVSPEEAMLSVAHVLNRLMDRFVEADLVERHGGIDAAPRQVRGMMRWLPDRAAVVGGDRVADRAALIRAASDAMALALPVETGVTPADLGDGPRIQPFSEDLLDSVFGDDVIARERRHTYVLRDEPTMADLAGKALMRAGFFVREGFDHRDENDAWNRRQGRRAKGDRRTNRGGKGRR